MIDSIQVIKKLSIEFMCEEDDIYYLECIFHI